MARNSKNESNDNRSGKAPAYIAYHVRDRDEGKSFWSRVGAAWAHEDGKGFSVNLDLVPAEGGRIVLRLPKEKAKQN